MPTDLQNAEAKIFALRKRIDRCLQVADTDTANRLQDQIGALQLVTGAVKGKGGTSDNRTA